MPVWCTKRSLPPSSGVMKPKPLSSLNHLTMPVAMMLKEPSTGSLRAARGGLPRQRLRALALLSPSPSLDLTPPRYQVGRSLGGERHLLGDVAAAGPRQPHERAGRAVRRDVDHDADRSVGHRDLAADRERRDEAA